MHKWSVTEMNRLTVEEFHEARKIPLVVVLDNVRSLHNIGAVFRTADAFRIEKIVLCGMSATPPNQEMHKTALGAELTVSWVYEESTVEAIDGLQQAGYEVWAVEQAEGSLNLDELTAEQVINKKIAVVLGHEVFGVQQEVVDKADCCLEIPQFGTKHSLNVSVAAGIVLYEISRLMRSLNIKH